MGELFHQRVELELEILAFPNVVLPRYDQCSEETAFAGYDIEDEIWNAIGIKTTLDNMRRFLIDVEEWLRQPCPEHSLNGFEFNPTDGPVCRANFLVTEEAYLNGVDDAAEATAELN